MSAAVATLIAAIITAVCSIGAAYMAYSSRLMALELKLYVETKFGPMETGFQVAEATRKGFEIRYAKHTQDCEEDRELLHKASNKALEQISDIRRELAALQAVSTSSSTTNSGQRVATATPV